MEHDANGLRILSASESLTLLSSGGVGRVALTHRALPVILPVSFRLLEDHIAFRTADALLLRAAGRRDVVCFEAGHADAASGEAWSVMVTGHLEHAASTDTLDRAEGFGPHGWSTAGGDLLWLPTDMINGRRTARSRAVAS